MERFTREEIAKIAERVSELRGERITSPMVAASLEALQQDTNPARAERNMSLIRQMYVQGRSYLDIAKDRSQNVSVIRITQMMIKFTHGIHSAQRVIERMAEAARERLDQENHFAAKLGRQLEPVQLMPETMDRALETVPAQKLMLAADGDLLAAGEIAAKMVGEAHEVNQDLGLETLYDVWHENGLSCQCVQVENGGWEVFARDESLSSGPVIDGKQDVGLVQWARYTEDGEKTHEGSYQYDLAGAICRGMRKDVTEEYQHYYFYREDGLPTKKTIHDHDEVSHEVYQYRDTGELARLYSINEALKLVSTEERLPDGSSVKYFMGKDEKPVLEAHRDKLGRTYRTVEYTQSGTVTRSWDPGHGDSRHPEAEEHRRETGDLASARFFRYREDGTRESERELVYGAPGKTATQIQTTAYNDRGAVVGQSISSLHPVDADKDGKLTDTGRKQQEVTARKQAEAIQKAFGSVRPSEKTETIPETKEVASKDKGGHEIGDRLQRAMAAAQRDRQQGHTPAPKTPRKDGPGEH